MEDFAPSTVDVRLTAVSKLVTEARKDCMLSHEDTANLTDIPNVREKGTRLGNWLTKELAPELLTVPERSTVRGRRDYAILPLLVGCALRRRELASLTVHDIQMRQNRWVIMDLLVERRIDVNASMRKDGMYLNQRADLHDGVGYLLAVNPVVAD